MTQKDARKDGDCTAGVDRSSSYSGDMIWKVFRWGEGATGAKRRGAEILRLYYYTAVGVSCRGLTG